MALGLAASAAGTSEAVAAPGADTSLAAQRRAAAAIPFEQLTVDDQEKVRRVLSRPSLFRRMPVQAIDCDPSLYLFLVRRPEVVVNIWRLMGVTQAEVRRLSPTTFQATDGAGVVCTVEQLHASPHLHLFYGEGYYQGPLLQRRLTGRCLLVLTSAFSTYDGNRPLVTHRLDVFLQVDNAGAELVAKVLHKLVGATADHNFVESSKFLGALSRAAERNGPGVEQLAARLAEVSPSVRREFATLATSVNHKALLRRARPARAVISEEAPPGDQLEEAQLVDP